MPYDRQPAWPHGPLIEVMPDLFMVSGTFRVDRWGLIAFPRNMAVLRHGGDLTIINSIRLSDAGAQQLESLGAIRHVVRLGAFHGLDDPYYLKRYAPTFWRAAGLKAPPGTDLSAGMKPDFAPGVTVFSFERTKLPELALRLSIGPGVLVVCDSITNNVSLEGFSPLLRWLSPKDRSSERCRIGSDAWLKRMRVSSGAHLPDDYARLLMLEFDCLLPAHGEFVRSGARQTLTETLRSF